MRTYGTVLQHRKCITVAGPAGPYKRPAVPTPADMPAGRGVVDNAPSVQYSCACACMTHKQHAHCTRPPFDGSWAAADTAHLPPRCFMSRATCVMGM